MTNQPGLNVEIAEQLPTTISGCHKIIRDVHAIIKTQDTRIAQQDTIIKQQHGLIEALQTRQHKQSLAIEALRTQVSLNSRNSSKSPSSDSKKSRKQTPRKPGSGKSSGGQAGHAGHHRALLDASAVDTLLFCAIDVPCESCGGSLQTNRENYLRHQVHELPVIKLHVTEYQLAKGRCGSCGHKQIASLPAGVNGGMTGPKLTSFMAWMVSECHLSRRKLQSWLKQCFHFDVSLGTLFNKQRLVNDALEAPVEALLPIVKASNCNIPVIIRPDEISVD